MEMADKIKAGWTDHKPGWQLRYNQLIEHVNEYDDPSRISPRLTPAELEWYVKSVATLKKENDEIARLCKKNGTEPWRTRYSLMYED